MAKIELEHVSMKFGDFYAVRDINLKVEEGEYITVLGPSGCGKTTLIKVISGIWKPTEGKVLVDGKDITAVPMEDRDIGYVFQNIALFPHMNLRENVGYSSRVKDRSKGEGERISTEYLELVKMLDRAGMLPGELSGGEQQKVGIARALASGSKMLMLDEPLSALDARVRVELRYDIRRLVKRLGITVLHVTHDQEEAMSVSDRILLMRAGGVQELGTPLEMYREPKSIFSAYFIGETNLLECIMVGKTKTGKSLVRLRGGRVVRAARSELEEGDAAVISVRPEHVYTANDGLKARVLDVVFMGTYWRVRTISETKDYVDYNTSGNEVTPKKGDKVNLVFNKKATKVFARPEGGIAEAIKLE
ncbi:MAG: ABC transporter ATP-binding protein [Candidatus Methanomethylophilaceae archaeon]|nr:ABC transporter ATP-binding protein [Candidatus Methanomethylophilaceae archaeon]